MAENIFKTLLKEFFAGWSFLSTTGKLKVKNANLFYTDA